MWMGNKKKVENEQEKINENFFVVAVGASPISLFDS